jgi:hypothetical protein
MLVTCRGEYGVLKWVDRAIQAYTIGTKRAATESRFGLLGLLCLVDVTEPEGRGECDLRFESSDFRFESADLGFGFWVLDLEFGIVVGRGGEHVGWVGNLVILSVYGR